MHGVHDLTKKRMVGGFVHKLVADALRDVANESFHRNQALMIEAVFIDFLRTRKKLPRGDIHLPRNAKVTNVKL